VSEQPTTSEEETMILVGGMTREEFLGEPERLDFPQPKRPPRKPSSPDSVEKSESE
jgi:hypothetical protein